MALSITELELQSTEYLPAREVMTTLGNRGDGHNVHANGGHMADGNDCNVYRGGIANGLNLQDLVNENDINAQVSLLNVLVEEVQASVPVGSETNDAIVQGAP